MAQNDFAHDDGDVYKEETFNKSLRNLSFICPLVLENKLAMLLLIRRRMRLTGVWQLKEMRKIPDFSDSDDVYTYPDVIF